MRLPCLGRVLGLVGFHFRRVLGLVGTAAGFEFFRAVGYQTNATGFVSRAEAPIALSHFIGKLKASMHLEISLIFVFADTRPPIGNTLGLAMGRIFMVLPSTAEAALDRRHRDRSINVGDLNLKNLKLRSPPRLKRMSIVSMWLTLFREWCSTSTDDFGYLERVQLFHDVKNWRTLSREITL